MNFLTALTNVYLADPGRVLPNPLWKTREIVDRCQADFALAEDGTTATHLRLSQSGRLFLYWDQAGRFELPPGDGETLTFALLHQRYAAAFSLNSFPSRELYFRLTHRHRPEPPSPDEPLPAGIAIAPVGIAEASGPAAAQVARFIGHCYDDLNPSAATVGGWRDHPTFNPDLWLWLIDEQRGQPAALGIAEYDELVGEGSLEWIQVLPGYRRRGVATILVAELLARLGLLGASFTTVAGRSDTPTDAEALYRHCGFDGDDRWWVLRR